jgi:hypothetical protein
MLSVSPDLDPATALSWACLGAAGVQWATASRADLSGWTLGFGLAAVAARPDPVGRSLIALAALVSWSAAWRGANRGVGRPELSGMVLALGAVLAALGGLAQGARWLAADQIVAGQASLLVFAGGLAATLAWERPWPRGLRSQWVRDVPIARAARSLNDEGGG